MTNIPFVKMHGTKNDFVILDLRKSQNILLNKKNCVKISDRKSGIGCDQVLILDYPKNKKADVFVIIRNKDGTQASICGNGFRCIAHLVMLKKKSSTVVIETNIGLFYAKKIDSTLISINMGLPIIDHSYDIPSKELFFRSNMKDFYKSILSIDVINIGNRHMVFFLNKKISIPINNLITMLKNYTIIENMNISICYLLNRSRIRMFIWENGVGKTESCGTGACAAVFSGWNRNILCQRKNKVILDGGLLNIKILKTNKILLAGQSEFVFSGNIVSSFFDRN